MPDKELHVQNGTERQGISFDKNQKIQGTFFDFFVSTIWGVFCTKDSQIHRKRFWPMEQMEFCERVSQYRYQFYITAYALLQNEADAEDAVCSAILNGYEHLAQLKNPKKFKSWMLTIIKNESLKLCRKRIALPGDENVEQLLQPTYDNHNELWDIVQTLKEEYRIVIVLFYYNELSLRDISDIMGISIGTVKSRLDRGRKLLKEALGE